MWADCARLNWSSSWLVTATPDTPPPPSSAAVGGSRRRLRRIDCAMTRGGNVVGGLKCGGVWRLLKLPAAAAAAAEEAPPGELGETGAEGGGRVVGSGGMLVG